MHVQWNNCFVCLNDLEAVRGGGRKKKVTPNNVKVLLRYLLQTASQSCDDQLLQNILQTFLENDSKIDRDEKQKTATTFFAMLCDECEDTTRRILDLQLELEVIQMKMIHLVKAMKETVVSKSKHYGNDEVTKVSLQAFERWLETQETLGMTFPRERKILDMLYTFQSVVFESAKGTVHIPCVYLERLRSSNYNPHYSLHTTEANVQEANAIKTEPDSIKDILNDLGDDYSTPVEFEEGDAEEPMMGFSFIDTNNDINMPSLAPPDISHSSHSPPILQKPSKSKKRTKREKAEKSHRKQRGRPRKLKVVESDADILDLPNNPSIKEELTELAFQALQDVKTEVLTRPSRSAANAAIRRISDVKNQTVDYQLVPRKGRKRKIDKEVKVEPPAHPNKILLNPLSGEQLDSEKAKKIREKKRKVTKTKKKRIKFMYKCESCPYQNDCRFKFEQHLRSHETDIVNLICPQCNRRFSGKQYYEYHQSFHDKSNRMVCDFCNERIDPTLLHDHCRTHVEKVFQCLCCSFCCTTREKYIIHTRYHGSANLVCDICEKPCGTRRRFYLHLHKVHKAVEKIKCDIGNCKKEFFDPALLNLHKKSHTAAFKCPECDRLFATANSLQVHMRQHTGKKEFKCDECPELFVSKSHLQRHKIREHGAPKYKCELCPKEYADLSSLRCHQDGVHGTGYPCDKCDKVYGNMSLLRRHQSSHSETKNFICEECGKGFTGREKFRMHLKIHVGERVHKCSYCPKAFVFRKYLICHLRIHTGERPYVCELCGKDFNQKAALWMHNKSQHKDMVQTNTRNEFDEECVSQFSSNQLIKKE